VSTIANTGAGTESHTWGLRLDAFQKLFPNVKIIRDENVGET